MPAPGFTLTDQAGRTVSLASLRGRAVALSFIEFTGRGDPYALTSGEVRRWGRGIGRELRSLI